MSFFRAKEWICIIDRKDDEVTEKFIDRGNFIVNTRPATAKEFEKACIEANIFINKKYLGCEY